VPRRHVRLLQTDPAVRAGLDALRRELDVPSSFAEPVEREADQLAAAPPWRADERRDATDVPFVTIDPEGSRDLDQAVHLERRRGGFRVRYAIADVGAWLPAGGAVDDEARERVVTLYAPDGRTPLHPPVLSEGAASLLPGQDAPAVVWTIDLDADGEPTRVEVEPSLVRSRAQLTYAGVQRSFDEGTPDEPVALLREVGELRRAAERARGGITLPTPEQVVERADGRWVLASRTTLPVEDWNAQVSLLTGMCAARLMLDGRVGVLRTLPRADERDVARLRRTARALGVDWPDGAGVGDVVHGLDASVPRHAAFLAEATTVLRGAAYVAFDGEPPDDPWHGAIAAPYAHATAPLRRLVDRFVSVVCASLAAGRPVPDWVRSALPELPERMAEGNRRASAYERGALDLVEAVLLSGREGEQFSGVVVDVREGRGVVQLADPVVTARVDGDDLPLGETVTVRLVEADVERRSVRFVWG